MDNETKFAFTALGIAFGIVGILALALYLANGGTSSYGLMGN